MTTLPLANLMIAPTDTGLVRIGDLTLPAWMAADIALRIAEAANSALFDAEGRREVREYLDRMYAPGKTVAVRDMSTGAVGKGIALRYGDGRASVRVGDSVDAWLLRDGDRARGFLRRWYADELAAGGFVAVTVRPFSRVSISWRGAARLLDMGAR